MMDSMISYLLNQSQDIVLSLCNNDYYGSNYMAAERKYWGPISRWLYLDSQVIRANNCLDIGCAYGTLSIYHSLLNKSKLYCIDFIDILNKCLIKTFNINYSTCNIELDDIPWDVKFDNIIFTEVLEHFNFHPLPTLLKIKNLLNEGGRIYFSTPDASKWGRLDRYKSYKDMPYPNRDHTIIDDHIYLYNETELKELIRDAGLEIERFDYSPGVGARHFNMTLIRRS